MRNELSHAVLIIMPEGYKLALYTVPLSAVDGDTLGPTIPDLWTPCWKCTNIVTDTIIEKEKKKKFICHEQ